MQLAEGNEGEGGDIRARSLSTFVSQSTLTFLPSIPWRRLNGTDRLEVVHMLLITLKKNFILLQAINFIFPSAGAGNFKRLLNSYFQPISTQVHDEYRCDHGGILAIKFIDYLPI